MYDLVIKNGLIIDGSGKKAHPADLGIKADKIAVIGDLKKEKGKTEINAEGKFVAPGFIDINNDADHYLSIFEQPQAENLIRQGITTILCGLCGASLAPLIKGSLISIRKWVNTQKFNVNWQTFKDFLDFLSQKGLGVNFASLVGWATLRRDLAGEEFRTLDKTELEQLKKILEQSLKEGAFGVSFGLGYSHEKMVGLSETIPVAELVNQYYGLVAIHLRDESANLMSALNEALEIAKQSSCRLEISHFKIIGTPYWDQFDDALKLIVKANHSGLKVGFDVYPYDINAQVLYLVLPEWIAVGGRKALLKNLSNPTIYYQALLDLKKNRHLYEQLIIADPADQWFLAGHTLKEIAENEGLSLEEALLKIVKLTEDRAIVFTPTLSEKNVIDAMKSKYSVIASNGAAYNLGKSQKGILVHPRAFGTFPRFLGYYVRDKKLMSWEEGIKKITSQPARRIGLTNRGLIEKNYFADLVIFQPDKIIDKATLKNPYQYSEGIESVIINGKIAYHRGFLEKKLLGQILRRI